jgi:hypothetical protein
MIEALRRRATRLEAVLAKVYRDSLFVFNRRLEE